MYAKSFYFTPLPSKFSGQLCLLLVSLAVSGCKPAGQEPEPRGNRGTASTESTSCQALTELAAPASAANILSGLEAYDSSGQVLTGTMANHGNWNMNTSAFPGAGYYSGLTSTITTTNVCTGTNIFGAAGAAVCQSGTTVSPAGAANILSGLEAWDATGTKITGSMTNRGALDASASFPGAGYYNGILNNPPTAGQIASGVTVLGVTGTLVGGSFADFMASMEHRDKATTQVTLKTESVTNAGTVYTNADPGYRAIPKISKDNDGYMGGSVTYVSRTGWDTTCDSVTGAGGGSANSVCKCGLSGTLAQRIADCAAHTVIGTNATWDGSTKGNAGQGTWKLVTRTGAVSSSKGREVWQDQRTGLMWSSLVSTSLNWCKATGSNSITGNPAAENDPGGYCDANSSQNNSGQAVSACFEDDGTYFTQTDAGIDSAGKGGLNRTSTPVVGWRNPTKYDYQQADNNGIRFVMPDMGPASLGWEWSATVDSNEHEAALCFSSDNGYMYSMNRGAGVAVRCVGR
jgi:hypothetical protein